MSVYDNLSNEFVWKIENAHNQSNITDVLLLK